MKIGNINVIIEPCLYCQPYGGNTDVPKEIQKAFKDHGYVEGYLDHKTHVFIKQDSYLLGKNIKEETIVHTIRTFKKEDKLMQFLEPWCTVGMGYESVEDFLMHEVLGDTLVILYAENDSLEVLNYGRCTNIGSEDYILTLSDFNYNSDWVGVDLEDTDSEENKLEDLRNSTEHGYGSIQDEPVE